MDKEIIHIGCFGDGGVGSKSALITQFVQNHFITEYDPTIENSYMHDITLNDITYSLDILDTAGQEEYSAMVDQYLRKTDCFMVGYSVTSRNSFEFLPSFIAKICALYNYNKNEIGLHIPIVILGNKIDLHNDREVSYQEGKEYADSIHAGFLETSAKDRINVDESFTYITNRYIQDRPIFNILKSSEYWDDLNKDDITCIDTCKTILSNSIYKNTLRIKDALLWIIIQNEYVQSCEWMLTNNCPQNINTILYGSTYLHEAIKKDNIPIIKLLLMHKDINVNITDGEDQPPIYYASPKALHLLKNRKHDCSIQ